MKEAIKYSAEDLANTLEQAHEQAGDNDFVSEYLSGVTRTLIESPSQYRSFGAYWWPLKELLLDKGISVFGDNVEAGTLSHFRLETPELVCCAAYAHQQTKLAANQLKSSVHLLELEGGETVEYLLHDEYMEALALHKIMKKN